MSRLSRRLSRLENFPIGEQGIGRRILTASADGTATLWFLNQSLTGVTCEVEAKLARGAHCDGQSGDCDGHHAGITSIALAPDKVSDIGIQYFATTSKDKTAKIWNVGAEKIEVAVVISFHPHQGFPVAEGDSSESKDGGPVHKGHTDYVNMACFNAVRNEIMTCSDDCTVKLWNATGGECMQTFPHGSCVPMATYDSRGILALTCSYDGTAKIWDTSRITTNPKALMMLEKQHTDEIWCARFHPNSKANEIAEVVTTSKDHTAVVWAFRDHAYVGDRVLKHDDGVVQAIWNPNSARPMLLTCSLDGTAKYWDLRAKAPVRNFTEHKHTVWSASFGSQEHLLVTAGHDMVARVYDLKKETAKITLYGHTGILWKAVFSADDQFIVTCSEDATARLWDLSVGMDVEVHRKSVVLPGHHQAVTDVAFLKESSDFRVLPDK